MFNKILRDENVPTSWCEIITKISYKKGDKSFAR